MPAAFSKLVDGLLDRQLAGLCAQARGEGDTNEDFWQEFSPEDAREGAHDESQEEEFGYEADR